MNVPDWIYFARLYSVGFEFWGGSFHRYESQIIHNFKTYLKNIINKSYIKFPQFTQDQMKLKKFNINSLPFLLCSSTRFPINFRYNIDPGRSKLHHPKKIQEGESSLRCPNVMWRVIKLNMVCNFLQRKAQI
jgi:hypothetical protein